MRKTLGLSILTLLATGLMLVVVGSASAEPSFVGDFNAAYPDSPLVGQCAVCHTGSPSTATVNSYGSDYAALGFQAIEAMDSDGDGADNITEIMAGFLPGVAGSTPPPPPPTTTVPPTTVPPTTVPPTTVPPTTAPPTTAPPTTVPPKTVPPTTAPPRGATTQTYDMMNAGQVTISFDGKRIVNVDVAANDGWSCHIDEQGWNEVEVECRGFGQEIEFEAEVEHDRLEVSVEVDDDDHADGHDDDDDDDHGDHEDDDDDDHGDHDDDNDHDDDDDDDRDDD